MLVIFVIAHKIAVYPPDCKGRNHVFCIFLSLEASSVTDAQLTPCIYCIKESTSWVTLANLLTITKSVSSFAKLR